MKIPMKVLGIVSGTQKKFKHSISKCEKSTKCSALNWVNQDISLGDICCCSCSISQSCPTLCDLMYGSIPGFPVLHYLQELAQTHIHWVGDAFQPSHLCHSLLLLPSVFPSFRVYFNELSLLIGWPKYWSFNFSNQSFQWIMNPMNSMKGWHIWC